MFQELKHFARWRARENVQTYSICPESQRVPKSVDFQIKTIDPIDIWWSFFLFLFEANPFYILFGELFWHCYIKYTSDFRTWKQCTDTNYEIVLLIKAVDLSMHGAGRW